MTKKSLPEMPGPRTNPDPSPFENWPFYFAAAFMAVFVFYVAYRLLALALA